MSAGPVLQRALVHASRYFERLITVEALRSGQQYSFHARPRWYVQAYLYAYDSSRFSMPNIAAMLHLANHTSVLHGLRRAHGHDGKLLHKFDPLWTKEHFEKLARVDRDGVKVLKASAEEIEKIGMDHLRANCPKFVFKTGTGWRAA
ncbi:MAG: hypothetical protein NXH88_10060 [Hyphomonas sp.]|nr:hypothetical protein [Hyphomonas sp.]